MKTYCCTKFGIFHQKDPEKEISIRIIKLPLKMMNTGIQGDNPFRVIITSGYKVNSEEINYMIIKHCPFCGIKLESCYNSMDFINESSEVFIPPDSTAGL